MDLGEYIKNYYEDDLLKEEDGIDGQTCTSTSGLEENQSSDEEDKFSFSKEFFSGEKEKNLQFFVSRRDIPFVY